MNREQAINYLISSGFTHEQVGEVVRALTYEPTTKNDLEVDCISRKAVLDAIDSKAWEFCDYLISKGRNDEQKPVSHFADNLRECVREEIPSVTPQLSIPEVTALAEWIEKLTKASEDAYNKGYEAGRKELEPKTGEWIEHFDESGKWYECDQCHTDWGGAVNFCPNCGTDMREVEE